MLAIIRKHHLKVAQFFVQNLLKSFNIFEEIAQVTRLFTVENCQISRIAYSSEFSHILRGYQGEVLSVESNLLFVMATLAIQVDLLIMFPKLLSLSTKQKTSSSLFLSGQEVSPCFEWKYNFPERQKNRLRLRVPENDKIITWTRK